MVVLAERLDTKLRESQPNATTEGKKRVSENIDLTDDVLNIMRSRAVEQEVLDLLDEPASPWDANTIGEIP